MANEFVYSLPTCVKTLKIPEDDINGQLRKRINKNSNRVVNDEMNNDWKLGANEQWETVFRHKSVNGSKLSVNCLPCLKYHCKGWCFKDCKNKASHKKLLNDDKSKTNAFIKSLRGEWYFGQESSDVLSYKIPPDKKEDKFEVVQEQKLESGLTTRKTSTIKKITDPEELDEIQMSIYT